MTTDKVAANFTDLDAIGVELGRECGQTLPFAAQAEGDGHSTLRMVPRRSGSGRRHILASTVTPSESHMRAR